MAAKNPDTDVIIAVASDHGQLVHVKLNDHIRERCPQLCAIPPDATLLNVYFKLLHTVLTYLDDDDSFSTFASHICTPNLLLVFAQTWALAARLCLPTL